MQVHKVIRIVAFTLLAILIVAILVYTLGNFAVERYLNTEHRKDITKYLPINGLVSYDRATVRLFNTFPNLSIKLEGLTIRDSMADLHKYPPLKIDELDVRARVLDLGEKAFEIRKVSMNGLTMHIFDDTNGYSNITSLIKKEIEKNASNKNGPKVVYATSTIDISNLILKKIDEKSNQRALVQVGNGQINNQANTGDNDISISLRDVSLAELSNRDPKHAPMHFQNVATSLSANQTFTRFSLKDLLLKNGHIKLRTDSLGLSNISALTGDGTQVSNTPANEKNTMQFDLHNAHVQLNNIEAGIIDHIKNKNLQVTIKNAETTVQMDTDTMAVIDVALAVDQLAFNTKKGAYLKNSEVNGRVDIHVSEKEILMNSPELLINGDQFDVRAALFFDGTTQSTLSITKPDAVAKNIRPILTAGIRQSIRSYDVSGPFYANANVVFTPGKKDPRVEVGLRIDDKTIDVRGQVIKNADVSATFVNRLFDDARQFNEDKRHVRFKVHRVRGYYNDLLIESEDALITSTPSSGDRLIAKARITGDASAASQYLKHDNFYFQDGKFLLNTDINGSLNSLDDLIAGTNLNLSMDDLEVHHPEGNSVFPFKILELNKQGEKTHFHIEGYTENYKRPFHIRGEVDRVESILFPGKAGNLRTEATIRASSVSWEGIVTLFGKEGLLSSVKQANPNKPKQSMKQTLSGIQRSFQPVVTIMIDTVLYGKDIQLYQFNTGLKFNDEKTLVLDETSFKIDKSNVTLNGEVIINELDFTRFDFDIELNNLDFDALMPKFDYFGIHLIKNIHDQPDNLSMQIELTGELDDESGLKPESIDAYITYESFAEDKFSGRISLSANPGTKKVDVIFGHSGHPRSFNHLIESDAYRFDKGWYTVSFQFDDNYESIAQMVENSKFNLTIDDAEVFISELGVTVPLTRIELASIYNKAYYHILLRSDTLDQEITFNGVVDNIRHFAFKDTDTPYEVELEISSPRIVWKEVLGVVAFKNQSSDTDGKTLKESLVQVLDDFNPNITLNVNELEYSDQVSFENIFAHAYFEENKLKIDSANVGYGDSQIKASIVADMGHADKLPFDLQLLLTNIDIGQTLAHFDYFNVDELREAKQLEGNVWLDVDLSGEMNLVKNGFNTDQTEAVILADLEHVVIEDLHTIDTITEGINMEKRFEVLRFAPINSKIKIKGNRVEIYQTEIQSNAIHAFVEGALDKNSIENLWISVPISNLKRPNLDKVPDKTGYEAAGKKVYLEWITSQDEDDGKMKLRLRKKKFYQERFKAKQFRAYKRINRRERKRLRQLRRKQVTSNE